MESAILKLPNDIQRIIFTYCGDVARAASCSVSKLWYQRVINASMHNSTVPQLYTWSDGEIDSDHMTNILADYHLTVRIGNNVLDYKREMCIAGSQSVCDLFTRLGAAPSSEHVIFSRNRQFHENMPINLRHMTVDDAITLFIDLVDHEYNDTVLEYFTTDVLERYVPNDNGDNNMNDHMELIWTIIHSNDIKIAQRIVDVGCMCVNLELMWEIVLEDAIDLIPAVRHMNSFVYQVCSIGSVAMFTRMCECVEDLPEADTLIQYAFERDNIALFDHMVSIGVNTNRLSFIDGIEWGALKCVMRIKPAQVNIREIIDAKISHNSNIKLHELAKLFQFSQDDFNYGLRMCIEHKVACAEFLPYANNYDVDLYKQHGGVRLI